LKGMLRDQSLDETKWSELAIQSWKKTV